MSENNKNAIQPSEDVKSIIAKRKKRKLIRILVISVTAVLVIAAVWLTLYLTLAVRPIARDKQQNQVVGKVGSYDVYYDELEYLVTLYKSDLEHKWGYVDWLGGTSLAEYCLEELENTVRAEITTLYATLALCEQKGVEIDSRELDRAVNNKVKELIDSDFDGKYSKYKKWLSEINMSDAYYRLILKVGILDQRLFDAMVAQGDEVRYTERNYKDFIEYANEGGELIRTTHVYYPKEYQYKEVDEDQTRETVADIAAHLKSIKSDSERYALINSYISKCPYLVGGISMSTLDGVYYFPSTMGEEYENAVSGLAEYGVSDMLETEDGFYVIMRLPVDEEYIGKNGIRLLELYQTSVVFKMLRQTEAELSFDGELDKWIKDVIADE